MNRSKRMWIGVLIGMMAPVLAGCSSESDAPADPVVDALDPVAVDAYFASALKGVQADYEHAAELAPGEIGAARADVWEAWRKAVAAADGEHVPAVSSHSDLQYWDYIETPDAVWQLPEGAMNIFYGHKGSRPSAGFPLFLFLHGSGSDAVAEWETTLAWAEYFDDGATAYFVPQSPQGGTGCRWYQPSRQAKWEQLLRQVLAGDEVDPARIYFMGISEGAYGSQRLASFYADYLAGAGPIAGGELLANCPPENLANLAFCLQTGAEDTMYGRSRLTEKVGAILDRLAGEHEGCYVHKVDLQPGNGHGCDYTVTTPWLVGHQRKANPTYVCWENFGLGGINGEALRYRDAFQNLRVLEPSDDRTDPMLRSVYELRVADNVVDLSVRLAHLATGETVEEDGWKMDLGLEKTYTAATKGRVRIYLNEELVDLSAPVTVRVNGVECFTGRLTPDVRHLVESCALFYDPWRVFPAAVDVSVD